MSGATGTAPGVLSPFDVSAFETGGIQAESAMANRYKQLGLGQTGASPTDPGSLGAGSTAAQMDLGAAPSLTGGIPAEVVAGLGQAQESGLASQLGLALSNLNTGNANKSTLKGAV
jgi:hypothetical protein